MLNLQGAAVSRLHNSSRGLWAMGRCSRAASEFAELVALGLLPDTF